MKKQYYCLIFAFMSIFAFSQKNNAEIIKITPEKLSKISFVKELATAISEDSKVISTEYLFKMNGKTGSSLVNGDDIYSAIKSNLVNKQGNIIYLSVKYIENKKVLKKEYKIIIE